MKNALNIPLHPFYVLRHGQTDWNVEMRLQGATDIPLNDTGRLQAREAATRFMGIGIDHILTSPLSRASETASIVGDLLGLKPAIEPRLIERNFGHFEGLDIEAVKAERALMGAHIHPEPDLDGRHYPIDSEPLSAVNTRIIECLNTYVSNTQTCLFVTHGIPFRVISRLIVGEMYSSPNACPVGFLPGAHGWDIVPLAPDRPPLSSRKFDGPTTMGRY